MNIGAVEWPTLLLLIQEILLSNLASQAGNPERFVVVPVYTADSPEE
jgi:hypothetical protein